MVSVLALVIKIWRQITPRGPSEKKRGHSITSKSSESIELVPLAALKRHSFSGKDGVASLEGPRPLQLTLKALKWIISHSAGGEAGRRLPTWFPMEWNKLWMWQKALRPPKGNESVQAPHWGPKWQVINRQMALIRLIGGGVGPLLQDLWR